MESTLDVEQVGTDAHGAPVFEIDGETFSFRGKTVNSDLIWQSETRQLVFRGPDHEFIDLITVPEAFVSVAPVQ
jgi:hypothetical protein